MEGESYDEPDWENIDWDAALTELLTTDALYQEAANKAFEWAMTTHGNFTNMDASGTVVLAVFAKMAGYPDIKSLILDYNGNAISWVIEVIESLVIQGVLIGLDVVEPTSDRAVFFSQYILDHMEGTGIDTMFNPPDGAMPPPTWDVPDYDDDEDDEDDYV